MDIRVIALSPGSGLPLELLADDLGSIFRLPAAVAPGTVGIEHALDPSRVQFHSGAVLLRLLDGAPPGDAKLLGVTGADLFLPVLTFVFGQAQVDQRASVFSAFRLRSEFYGLPVDPDALYHRSLKEAMHELGHTFGLRHCREHPCVMNASTYVEDIDLKPLAFCEPCRAHIERRIGEAA
jgi:archaemetzincin